MSLRNFAGASVNAVGTKIATAKALGTGVLGTAVERNDSHTLISHGAMQVPVKTAINMGLLNRTPAGVLEELNPPQSATRAG
jgi:hypothetical protein